MPSQVRATKAIARNRSVQIATYNVHGVKGWMCRCTAIKRLEGLGYAPGVAFCLSARVSCSLERPVVAPV